MAEGMSLSIGVNELDPKHYGMRLELEGCENDAMGMLSIARSRGFSSSTVLLTSGATRSAVSDHIKLAAGRLVSGDIFMLSFSGHGGQVPDQVGDEEDQMDETWCLYDGELIDDELNLLLGEFEAGVRVVVFSDSCSSGTVTMGFDDQVKGLPSAFAWKVYDDNRAFYDEIMANPALKDARESIAASVLLLAACRDYERAKDNGDNGAFTSGLMKVWNGGTFVGNYLELLDQVKKEVQTFMQHPCLFKSGHKDPAFEQQAALMI